MKQFLKITMIAGIGLLTFRVCSDFLKAENNKPVLDPPYVPAGVPVWATEEDEVGFDIHSGTVIDVSKTSITLTRPEKTLVKHTTPLQVVHIPAGPPRTFMLTKELAEGGHQGKRDVSAHKLSDVRIGDNVVVEYSRTKSVSTCDTIRISDRMSGKIPPRANGKYTPEAKQQPVEEDGNSGAGGKR